MTDYAAGARAMQEAAARVVEDKDAHFFFQRAPEQIREIIAAAIRTLPLPPAPAGDGERAAERAFLIAWENAAPLTSVSWVDFQEIKRAMVPLIAAALPPAPAGDGERAVRERRKLECASCWLSPADVPTVVLHRINRKGIPGVFLCEECLPPMQPAVSPAALAATQPPPTEAERAALERAVDEWIAVGNEKVMHVLTCPECKRLEKKADHWCTVATGIGRRQLKAAEAIRAARAAQAQPGAGETQA